MERLSKLGFESQALRHLTPEELNAQGMITTELALGTVNDEVEAAARVASKSVPPILVSHGLGSYVAQKYLESYPARGLVMVAPFPPNPESTIRRLAGVTSKLLPENTHTNCGDWKLLLELEPNPNVLLRDSSRYENTLNLEPLGHYMEVLLVTTQTDPVVDPKVLESVYNWHELEDSKSKEVKREGSNGHLTMAEVSWETPGGMSDQIVDWIDKGF